MAIEKKTTADIIWNTCVSPKASRNPAVQEHSIHFSAMFTRSVTHTRIYYNHRRHALLTHDDPRWTCLTPCNISESPM